MIKKTKFEANICHFLNKGLKNKMILEFMMPATSISWSVESHSLESEAALQSAGIWRMRCIFCQMAAGRTKEKFTRPGVKKRTEGVWFGFVFPTIHFKKKVEKY